MRGDHFFGWFDRLWRFAGALSLLLGAFLPAFDQFGAHHPKIGQRKQCDELSRVFLQTMVANLHKSELTLDHPQGVLNLGANAGLQFLRLVKLLVPIQNPPVN